MTCEHVSKGNSAVAIWVANVTRGFYEHERGTRDAHETAMRPSPGHVPPPTPDSPSTQPPCIGLHTPLRSGAAAAAPTDTGPAS